MAVIRQLPLVLPQDGKVSRSSHFCPAQSMKFHCGFLPNKPWGFRRCSNQPSTWRTRGRWRRDHRGIGLMQRPVRKHSHPGKRKRGDDIGFARRIAALHQPAVGLRFGEGVDGVRGEARVARDGIGDQHFQARVAGVLHLLPVGTVHEGFVRVDAQRAPADAPDRVQRRVAALEARQLLKWIAGFMHAQGAQRERLGAGAHVDFDETKSAPPQRREAARSAIRDKRVVKADHLPVVHEIAIALAARGIVQRLAIVEPDDRVAAAGDLELRVGRDHGVAPQQ